MRIGIIREGKVPADYRVALTPSQCRHIMDHFPVEIRVQSSQTRSYSDDEYRAAGIAVVPEVADCEVLLGIKEVPVSQLIPQKTYFFFSHTIKAQPYNRGLLQKVLERDIRLVDYEVITDDLGKRVIAFGIYAGMVGAHNALWAYGQRTGKLDLPRIHRLHDYAAARDIYNDTEIPPLRLVLSGTGKVGNGAVRVLEDMGFARLSTEDYLKDEAHDYPVYTVLSPKDYVRHVEGNEYSKKEFYTHPERFENAFLPYAHCSDILIHGIYWDPAAPVFFTREDMLHPDWQIITIADVTCDIAPESSIPATLRPATIEDPVFGYDPQTNREIQAFDLSGVDMMTIDYLPNELPRDASEYFGQRFIDHVLPELLSDGPMIARASIAQNGALTERYQYLQDYVKGN